VLKWIRENNFRTFVILTTGKKS